MKGHTHIIRTDGSEEHQDHDHMPDLAFWQQAVGGHIEAVPAWPDPRAVVFCNEEGKIHGLPYNENANDIWQNPHDQLYGDIVIATGDAEFMRAL